MRFGFLLSLCALVITNCSAGTNLKGSDRTAAQKAGARSDGGSPANPSLDPNADGRQGGSPGTGPGTTGPGMTGAGTDAGTDSGTAGPGAGPEFGTDSGAVTIDHVTRINCVNKRFYSENSAQVSSKHYDIPFVAGDCDGGVLPNENYIGFYWNQEICGADMNWLLIQSQNGSAPSASVEYRGACSSNITPSLIAATFIHKSSTRNPGEAPAANQSELLARLTSRSSSIRCHIGAFEPAGKIISPQQLYFAAGDCGGTVPDDTYSGIIIGSPSVKCGRVESFGIILATKTTAPGLTFWIMEACATAGAGSDFEALFIKSK